MRKILGLIIGIVFSITSVFADTLPKTITNLKINKSALSISIKSVEDGSILYALNSRTPMPPASTLKLVTTFASLDTLGNDFTYSTKLYKSTNNDLYLQLSGDPLLKSKDLEDLISVAKAKEIAPKTFYIDDTAFDKIEWGEGWQWDDALNPLMPKFSIFNINGNLFKLEISPTEKGAPAQIVLKPFYPITIMNMVNTDFSTPDNIKIERNLELAPNILNATGTISKNIITKIIPVPNPKINFTLRLEDAIKTKKLEYYEPIKYSKLPDKNVYLVDSIDNNIDDVLNKILKNSDNLFAETLFKTAGAKYANTQGNITNSLNMLTSYLNKLNFSHEDIKIVDGSGVSKNNLMTTDFMTNFLIYLSKNDNFEKYMQILPTSGEGTLKDRMLYFKGNLRAKTGTLSDTSAIAGYITSRKGNLYTFDIMINDAKTSSTDKKNIEEQILRSLYANY
jgi:D-alanyl-D-alanine carboxypeptidase/D-alanyl-D-alanine-endopeptidase (penicillin-binding protein 4)